MKIIFNTLMILDDETTNDEEKSYYLEGLLKILSPTNEIIRKWKTESPI